MDIDCCTSVDALCAFPVDDINEIPGILTQLELELAFLVDDELRGRVEEASAFVFFLIIEIEFPSGQIEGLALRIKKGLTKANLTIGNKADFATGGSRDHADKADVIA